MSSKQFREKPSFYKRRYNENLFHYILYLIRCIIQMFPSARAYGIRYYLDHDYRMICIYKERKRREKVRRRKREGYYFRKHQWRIKALLIERDGQICVHCHQPFEWRQLTFDHIIRLEAGGTSILENLQLLCVPCHKVKTRQEHLILNAINKNPSTNLPPTLIKQK